MNPEENLDNLNPRAQELGEISSVIVYKGPWPMNPESLFASVGCFLISLSKIFYLCSNSIPCKQVYVKQKLALLARVQFSE